jgi:hypothetical protein
MALMKLFFHPGTNMAQAMAETIGYVTRSRAFMPPGTVSPFITRFDAGSVPVGYVGHIPSSYPINAIYQWTAAPRRSSSAWRSRRGRESRSKGSRRGSATRSPRRCPTSASRSSRPTSSAR